MINQKKYLFIDRDGTLIKEPPDCQIDSFEKLFLLNDVIPSLLKLKEAAYRLVMISNQDGLGTSTFPFNDFKKPHELMLNIFESQGVAFENVLICPHLPINNCHCRKPKLGLIMDYLIEQKIDKSHSYVIGDRESDIKLAKRMGIKSISINQKNKNAWIEVTQEILSQSRRTSLERKTSETTVSVEVNLDKSSDYSIETGIPFFNHMLEQLSKHGGFGLKLLVKGDLEIDDHHTVEDTAIALGSAIKIALGDKIGIARYGFLLPMDDAQTQIALDLAGRFYFDFKGNFKREKIGDLSTELIPHFFRSFAESLKATLHIDVRGENTHHMIESIFKGLGRVLRQAITKIESNLPSTKGIL